MILFNKYNQVLLGKCKMFTAIKIGFYLVGMHLELGKALLACTQPEMARERNVQLKNSVKLTIFVQGVVYGVSQ